MQSALGLTYCTCNRNKWVVGGSKINTAQMAIDIDVMAICNLQLNSIPPGIFTFGSTQRGREKKWCASILLCVFTACIYFFSILFLFLIFPIYLCVFIVQRNLTFSISLGIFHTHGCNITSHSNAKSKTCTLCKYYWQFEWFACIRWLHDVNHGGTFAKDTRFGCSDSH